jgi:hypothetical protein
VDRYFGYVTTKNRQLAERVARVIRDNEATLRHARDIQRRQPEIQRAMRDAQITLRQLRRAGLVH